MNDLYLVRNERLQGANFKERSGSISLSDASRGTANRDEKVEDEQKGEGRRDLSLTPVYIAGRAHREEREKKLRQK